MNLHSDAREFLKSRRDRVTPQAAGLPSYGRNRRVPGLRREEVALLAGVSVDYYTRLERGNLSGVSEEVLAAVAGALQLDEAERSHLFDLAKATNSQSLRRRNTRGATRAQEKVRPEVQRILDAMADTPAFILTDRADMLTTNQLGRALFAPLYDSPVSPGTSGQAETVNIARFTFLDPVAREFFPTGSTTPPTWPPACAARPGATLTTRSSAISSGNWPPAARTSPNCGPTIMCGCTGWGGKPCTTRSSGTWSSTLRLSSCRRTQTNP